MTIGKIIRPIVWPFAVLALGVIHAFMWSIGERCKSALPADDILTRNLQKAGVPMPITCERIACHFGQCRGVVQSRKPELAILAPGKVYWDEQ